MVRIRFELAKKEDIKDILAIYKERCKWFRKKHIKQWNRSYYLIYYNASYLKKMMKNHLLYVVKREDEVVGTFLLKEYDEIYWKDDAPAFYLRHFASKLNCSHLGDDMLSFIENLARKKKKKYIRGEVVESNSKIQEYWFSKGFKLKERRQQPYNLIMVEKEVEDV